MIGDIVGEAAIRKVKETIPEYIRNNNIDFVIANGENASEGVGINSKIFNTLMEAGINVVTMGNHTWGKKDIFNILDDGRLIRPANYPKNVPGRGYGIYEANGKKIAVINLMGRVDMNILIENPFIAGEDIVNEIKDSVDIIIVDFHAEATAEKIAMGYYLDGKVTAILGTHTHVMTADEQILEGGTAYITDVGMTGPKKSVIGMEVDASIKRFLTAIPERYKVSADPTIILNGCILEINDSTCRTERIERIIM